VADNQVERNHRMLEYRPATERAVANLVNWVEGTASLARDETAYLERAADLLCVNTPTDDALVQLEETIECAFARFCKAYRKVGAPRRRKPKSELHFGYKSRLTWRDKECAS